MSSRHFLHSQTELLDSCLAELSQLANRNVVNFNNTAQFDELLTHLELSFLTPSFCQVPSVYVLHVLVTLAARCPESNWSHDPGLGAVASSTEYMRRVNHDYDSSLDKSPLSHRSAAILSKYMGLVSSGVLSKAQKMLLDNMNSVFSQLAPEPARSAKSAKSASISPRKTSPLKASPRKTRLQRKLQASDTAQESGPDVVSGLYAVEVISDSEDSDCPLEVLPRGDVVSEQRTVISLSELAANTSGLGEVASLFKGMPHLSAHATPEPEVPAKKPKSDRSLWRRIQVYDDDVLAARVGTEYTFWDLVRWMFWCADSSSQYQKFLFNSQRTCVHSCYTSYSSVVKNFMDLCAIQLGGSHTSLLLASLYLHSHEKTVEIIFSGLGSEFRNKPFPCYTRELMLLAHDPGVRVSQCKKALEYDDNMDSMDLRVSMLTLFSYYERYSEKRRPDIRSLVQRKNTPDRILVLAAEKVRGLCVQYTKAFFGALQTVVFFKDYAELFMVNLAMAVLSKVTDIEVSAYSSLEGQFLDDVMGMISSEKFYRGITEDLSTESLEKFFEKWNKAVFLAEWVMGRAICRMSEDNKARSLIADEVSHTCMKEFLESRCEDADLIEDSAFTITREEVEASLGRASCRFARIAQGK